MPFYEYQCAACGHHHEELQKVSDRALRKCPACGRPTLKRLVSAPVFRLKGGGWYETDFKNDKEAKRNIAGEKEPATAADSPAEKPKDEKADAKPAETKPEAAPAPKPAPVAKKSRAIRRRSIRRRPARR
jgi:putative FmdB family regulatory protein